MEYNQSGWVVSFYFDDNNTTQNRETHKYLSWSPYDRISVEKISAFKDFFNKQFDMSWVGMSQQMHLIPIYPQPFSLRCHAPATPNSQTDDYLIQSVNPNKLFGLNCIIALKFDESIKNNDNVMDCIVRHVYSVIKNTMKTESDKEFEIGFFDSLGPESLVIIALANDIKTFGMIVSILKSITVDNVVNDDTAVFSSVDSYLGFNTPDYDKNPNADLIVRLTLKSNKCFDAVKKEFENFSDDIKMLFNGNSIVDIRIPSSDMLLTLFHDNGVLNGSSNFYKDYIASSRSYWVNEETLTTSSILVLPKDSFILEDVASHKNLGLDTRSYYPSMAKFLDNEYNRIIKSKNFSSWRFILNKQHKGYVEFVESYNENEWGKLYPLLNQVQSSLQHIRQATTPVSELPYHNYSYAGSYNDILKMYYGIVASIFNIGRSMPHGGANGSAQQHKISFCINFESATTSHSMMYGHDREGLRFVVFHLPFSAFTDIKSNVKFLAHEIFHFIAPYDREARNNSIIELWADSIVRNFISCLYESIRESVTPNILNKIESNSILNTIKNRLLSDTDLYRDIKDEVTKNVDNFGKFILNDFTDSQESIQNIFYCLNSIHEIIYKQSMNILADMSVTNVIEFDLVAHVKNKKTILINKLNSAITRAYLKDNLIKIADAYKEAFCDYSMIKLLNMDLADYLKLTFDALKRKLTKNIFDSQQYNDIRNMNIDISSFELRLCIILDLLVLRYENKMLTLKKMLEEIDGTEEFNNFEDYCLRAYRSYQNLGVNYKNIISKLFTPDIAFWDAVNNNIYHNISKELQWLRDAQDLPDTNSGDSDIQRTVKFLKNFVNYDIHEVEGRVLPEQQQTLSSHFEFANERYCEPYATIKSIDEYIRQVCVISKFMSETKGYNNEPCWYRGLFNSKYNTLPSLIRSFYGDWTGTIQMSPYAYQTKVLKDAYFLTLDMPDLWTKQLQGIEEHMSCLQHYGMKTNLLDFSLDMLVALHFALNPDNEEDKKRLSRYECDPKVSIFNPAKYNKAIMCLLNGRIIDDSNYKQLSPVIFNIDKINVDGYFVSDMSSEYSYKDTERALKDNYVPDIRINKYPQPIIIRHSQDRILSQNGVFLAYNLFAGMPKVDKKACVFEYLDLYKIQREYLSLYPSSIDAEEKEKEKFIRDVIIDRTSVDDIRDDLEYLGLNKGKVYPELDNVFSEYSKKQQFN